MLDMDALNGWPSMPKRRNPTTALSMFALARSSDRISLVIDSTTDWDSVEEDRIVVRVVNNACIEWCRNLSWCDHIVTYFGQQLWIGRTPIPSWIRATLASAVPSMSVPSPSQVFASSDRRRAVFCVHSKIRCLKRICNKGNVERLDSRRILETKKSWFSARVVIYCRMKVLHRACMSWSSIHQHAAHNAPWGQSSFKASSKSKSWESSRFSSPDMMKAPDFESRLFGLMMMMMK